ncbi:hypothetical protein Tco_1283400 [Tanacetum coccineum]
MTRSTVKRLTKPLDKPEREFRRLRRANCRLKQNESLAIAERNLFDDEASSSSDTEVKPPTPPKTLHEHSRPNSFGFQNPITLPAEQTGRIIDARDILLIQGTCTCQGLRNEDPLCHVKKSETPKPEAPNFAIITRLGIITQDSPFPTLPLPTSDNLTEEETKKEGPEGTEPSIIQEPAPRPSIFYQPSKLSNPPFLSRLKKQKKDDKDERLLSIFKQIHINLPFLEAMIHMPKGAKVLKDLLSHKEKLKKAASSVKLSEECSAIIQRSLLQKEGDPGSFTLPCLIRPLAVKNGLVDLGASINIMPHSLFRRLEISELKPTKMIDFIVLEIDEDELVPIILGLPFLATARAVIDVHEGKLSLRVRSETVTFNIRKSADTVNHDRKWTKEEEEEDDSNKVLSISFYPRIEPMKPLEWKAPENRLKLSCVEPPKLELKELPKNFEYAILQDNNQLPMVISLALSIGKKARLLEDEFKPSVQPQRRVNPNIKEVVKKEVIKLLNAGLIYPIFDSHWVSPIQVLPKKGGMTIVKNEKDELILQRMDTGWLICIDYYKLNNATQKDHFPLPFIDQMLERLARHEYCWFLDGVSGYFHIPIAPEDQEKTTFTCPYGTFAYKRMPFELCNAPTTF